jgi:hypothetical protein
MDGYITATNCAPPALRAAAHLLRTHLAFSHFRHTCTTAPFALPLALLSRTCTHIFSLSVFLPAGRAHGVSRRVGTPPVIWFVVGSFVALFRVFSCVSRCRLLPSLLRATPVVLVIASSRSSSAIASFPVVFRWFISLHLPFIFIQQWRKADITRFSRARFFVHRAPPRALARFLPLSAHC